jgi:ribonuclease III
VSASVARLCRQLGYTFKDISLLERALTHRSAQGKHNERLEFLGDSIVNFVIAEELFHAMPQASEGRLTRLRASLVKGETLAALAKEFSLGEYVRLGSGELKSGGMRRPSILADTMEAVIAAIYLDGGIEPCIARIRAWYETRLEVAVQQPVIKDPKTCLQEFLQAKRLPLPEYTVISVKGAAHEQTFHVRCAVAGLSEPLEGISNSRRAAEQQAATEALKLLGYE